MLQKYFTVTYLKLLTLKNDFEPEIVICLLSLSKTKNVCVEIDNIQQKKETFGPCNNTFMNETLPLITKL